MSDVSRKWVDRRSQMEAPAELSALDRILSQVDSSLLTAGEPRLNIDERVPMREDLSRVPELISSDHRFRGHGPFVDNIYPLFVPVVSNWIIRRRQDLSAPLLDEAGRLRSSLATLYYYHALRTELEHYEVENRFDPVYVYVAQRSVWDGDDLDEQRRMYERSKDVLPPETPAIQRFAMLRVGDLLYDTTNPRYSGLGSELDRLGVDWRAVVLSTPLPVGSATSARENVLTEAVLTRLRGAIEQVVRTRAQAVSRQSRSREDQLDLAAGALKPNCVKWTYEELEYWLRWNLRKLSASTPSARPGEQTGVLLGDRPRDVTAPGRIEVLCDWLDRNRERYKIQIQIGEGQTFVASCRTLDAKTLQQVVHGVVRLVAKSALCDLLLALGLTPPSVYGRLSYAWYNLDLLHGYLPGTVLAQLMADLETRQNRFWTLQYTPQRSGDILPRLAMVVDDLFRQLKIQRAEVQVEVSELIRFLPLDLQEYAAIAVVALSGQTLLSPVTTGQRREGDVRSELADALLTEPMTALLEPGDALTIRLPDLNRSTSEALYDYAVARPSGPPTFVLIVRVVPRP